MDRELAFSTFLKLLELAEPQKAATLRGFKRGGGFNYWRPLQVLAPEVANDDLSFKEMQEKIGMFAKSHQRKYNEKALTNLMKWTSRRKIMIRTRPEKVVKKFGNSGLKVRIEPELSFFMGGRNYLMHIWATNNPTLSDETLSMGLYFFRRHFHKKKGYKNHQYLIFDTVKDIMFAEFNIFESAPEMLGIQRKILSDLWEEVDGRPITPSKKPTRDDELPPDHPRLHS